ncbi:GntR family transcriptional regulator [Rhodococcus qingshengii]|uniref:GntR family transcriptional regulator n=1 Tax=Rhodococcus qingshengii TaxID=334542 RepID=UPI0021B14F99|nr:GntR family transcriptional regulator [Rhodococcus qingshengii]MCT6735440.1 GntR family transcriptional regulator [Rhodococcus qingshengii]
MNRRSRSREIALALRNDIDAGVYQPGDLLPSGRSLAEQWEVSRSTVMQAFAQLVAAGLIESVHGSGHTVALNQPGSRRPHVLLIGGYAGSGKSELGRILARLTHWPIIDKDTITRPVVEAALETLDRSYDDRESEDYVQIIRPREYEALASTIDENIACGTSVIATAPFVHEFSDPHWAARTLSHYNAQRAEVHVLWVRCSTETMQLYLRRRGAGRDGWKLSNWNSYIADVDTNFTPVLDHTVIVNDPDSEPLQDQARAFLTSIGAST